MNNPFNLPEKLSRKYLEVEKSFGILLDQKNYLEAERQWLDLYKYALKSQKKYNTRLHKGGIVHNLGIISLFLGRFNDSYSYFLRAFIEDSISHIQGFLEDPLSTPGATNLKTLFQVNEVFLNQLIKKLSKNFDQLELGDPDKWYRELLSKKKFDEGSRPTSEATKISEFKQDGHDKKHPLEDLLRNWNKRVFIGGSYRTLESEQKLMKIREIVDSLGFDPILPSKFVADQDGKLMTTHNKSLLLLHSCKYAIFEKSQDSGYLMEVERTLDYKTRVLIVQNTESNTKGISTMLTSLSEKKDDFYDARSYSDDRYLEKEIKDFLNRNLS